MSKKKVEINVLDLVENNIFSAATQKLISSSEELIVLPPPPKYRPLGKYPSINLSSAKNLRSVTFRGDFVLRSIGVPSTVEEIIIEGNTIVGEVFASSSEVIVEGRGNNPSFLFVGNLVSDKLSLYDNAVYSIWLRSSSISGDGSIVSVILDSEKIYDYPHISSWAIRVGEYLETSFLFSVLFSGRPDIYTNGDYFEYVDGKKREVISLVRSLDSGRTSIGGRAREWFGLLVPSLEVDAHLRGKFGISIRSVFPSSFEFSNYPSFNIGLLVHRLMKEVSSFNSLSLYYYGSFGGYLSPIELSHIDSIFSIVSRGSEYSESIEDYVSPKVSEFLQVMNKVFISPSEEVKKHRWGLSNVIVPPIDTFDNLDNSRNVFGGILSSGSPILRSVVHMYCSFLGDPQGIGKVVQDVLSQSFHYYGYNANNETE